MAKVKVYRFKTWDVRADEYFVSRRYATKEAVEEIAGGVVIEDSEIEIDEAQLGTEIIGMTVRGFFPRSPGYMGS